MYYKALGKLWEADEMKDRLSFKYVDSDEEIALSYKGEHELFWLWMEKRFRQAFSEWRILKDVDRPVQEFRES
jgi:hypothetical protein